MYAHRLVEAQQELEEYQSHSAELEEELEVELKQSQTSCSELRHQVAKLSTENEDIKVIINIINVIIVIKVTISIIIDVIIVIKVTINIIINVIIVTKITINIIIEIRDLGKHLPIPIPKIANSYAKNMPILIPKITNAYTKVGQFF